MARERLVRVKRFEELATGMTVVTCDCECGRSRCRAMLMNLVQCDDTGLVGFECAPPCFDLADNCELLLGSSPVNRGVVFRVVDGYDKDETTDVKVPRELEREGR